ncbi:MAG: MFS transporter [bacterium]|nr:MFS transporter [bacterium]
MAVVSRLILLCIFNQATTAAVSPYVQIILRNKGYSHSIVGLILAFGQIATVIIPMLIGLLSDRTRKTKPIIIVLAMLSCVAFMPAALSGSLVLTFITFFLASGIFWSTHPIVDGYETRLLKGDASKYGLIRSMGTMGYIVFLIIFGITGFPDQTDNTSICTSIAIVCAALVVVSFFIPNDIPAEKKELRTRFSLSVFSRKFYLMMLLVGLSRISQAVIEKLLSSYMMEVMGMGGNFVLYVAWGAFCEFLMILFGGKLLQKGTVSAYSMILLSFIGLAVRLLIYCLFPSVVGFVFGQTLHALTFGALHIGVTKFIAQNVEPAHYSLGQSFYWAIATNLPEMLGALAGGFIIDWFGYRNLFAVYSVFPAVAAILCIAFRKTLASVEKTGEV